MFQGNIHIVSGKGVDFVKNNILQKYSVLSMFVPENLSMIVATCYLLTDLYITMFWNKYKFYKGLRLEQIV